jgi:hypothetical protein
MPDPDAGAAKPQPVSPHRLALAGHCAIAMVKDATHTYFMTAVSGGGRPTEAIHTDATAVKDWEKFRIIGQSGDPNIAIQTSNGHFLTAVDGGGRVSNAITSVATEVQAWELFACKPVSGAGVSPHFSLQTPKGNFVTALSHGGLSAFDTIHTDATVAQAWEMFDFLKIGDPGPSATYRFEGVPTPSAAGGYLCAIDGGRHAERTSLMPQLGPEYTMAITVIRQADGTFALKTASGYYITANAGGLAGAGYRTDTPQVNNWEKFTLIADETDCTSRIRTYSGTYLSIVPGHSPNPPLVIDNVADITKATRWRLWVMSFYA